MQLFKKRILLLGLTSALLISAFPAAAVYAEDTDSNVQQVQTKTQQTFTIDDAIKYAKENSSSLASAKSSVDYAKSSASEAKIAQKKLKDSKGLSISDVNTLMAFNGYTYEAAKMNYRMAQRAVIQTEYSLESNVSSLFYTYLSNAEKVKIAESSLAAAQERKKAAEIKHENGFISDIDMNLFNLSEIQAQNDLNSSKRQLELSMMNFKSGINYPLDQPLQLSGTFTRPEKEATSYDTALKKIENSITRANTEDTLKLAELKAQTYNNYYTSNQPGWYSGKAEFATAQLTYNNSVNNEKINLYTAWNGVQTVYEALNALDISYDTAKKQVEAAKLSYNLGTLSANDYLDKERDLYSSQNTLLDTELNAYLANEQYRLLFDCENTIFEEDNN